MRESRQYWALFSYYLYNLTLFVFVFLVFIRLPFRLWIQESPNVRALNLELVLPVAPVFSLYFLRLLNDLDGARKADVWSAPAFTCFWILAFGWSERLVKYGELSALSPPPLPRALYLSLALSRLLSRKDTSQRPPSMLNTHTKIYIHTCTNIRNTWEYNDIQCDICMCACAHMYKFVWSSFSLITNRKYKSPSPQVLYI